ncbi:hypothetical protein TNCV_745681 [Trichonephila clavipes]|nr:hypothetical protein TNCV_745681 [Trichonephila clavipes]
MSSQTSGQLLESEDIDWSLAGTISGSFCGRMGFSPQTSGNSFSTSNDSGAFDWRCKTNDLPAMHRQLIGTLILSMGRCEDISA